MRTFLLATAAAVAFAAPVCAQDVVMRRPLPVRPNGSATVPTTGTPTPVAGTPTPGAGTPTPGTGTPTPGTGTPTPSNPSTGNEVPTTPTPTISPTPSPSSTPYVCNTSDPAGSCFIPGVIVADPFPGEIPDPSYGWKVDCINRNITCMKYVQSGWFGMFEPVANTACPATQSATANAAAHGFSYFGMGEGVDATHGLEFCDGDKPLPETTYYNVGKLTCNRSEGVYKGSCTRYMVANNPTPGDPEDPWSFPQPVISVSEMPTTDACKKQEDTPEFNEFAQTNTYGGYASPADMRTKENRACGYYRDVTGTTCTPEGPVCKRFIYEQYGDTAYVRRSFELPASECASGTSTQEERDLFEPHGIVLAGQNTSGLACVAPTVYGAKGTCRTYTTRNTDGSTSIDRRFDLTCAAIKGDNAVEAADAYCINQRPTPAQKQLLASLAPNFYDYSEMDTTCTSSVGVNLNYQRNYMPVTTVNNETTDVMIDGKLHRQYSRYQEYEYVCTDETNNDYDNSYYYGPMARTASTYKVTNYPCDIEHTIDKVQMGEGSGSFSYHGTCNERVDPNDPNSPQKYKTEKYKPYCGVVVEDKDDGIMKVSSREVIEIYQ